MNYIKKMRLIKKISRKVGTPLKAISFDASGVKFTFAVEGEVDVNFSDADTGVQQVLDWLVEMLPKEAKLDAIAIPDEVPAEETEETPEETEDEIEQPESVV